MGLRELALLATGIGGTLAKGPRVEARQGTDAIGATQKYCPGGTEICFSEYATPTDNIVFRVAIPDVDSAPFDILLQIVAPISTGWAGLAWGGVMTGNPLTVAWPNGDDAAVVSSRWATGHSRPMPYDGATYKVLPTSSTNDTHWQLDVLCSGCSQWDGASLDPNGANNLAWAKSNKAVTTPSNNESAFAYHDGKGTFSHDLSAAKIPKDIFESLVNDAGQGSEGPGTEPTTSEPAAEPTTSSEPEAEPTDTDTAPTQPATSKTTATKSSRTTSPARTTPTLHRPTTSLNITITEILPTASSTKLTTTSRKTTKATTTTTTMLTRTTRRTTTTRSSTWYQPDEPITTIVVTSIVTATTIIPWDPPVTQGSDITTFITAVPPTQDWPTGRPRITRPPWRRPPWRRPPVVE